MTVAVHFISLAFCSLSFFFGTVIGMKCDTALLMLPVCSPFSSVFDGVACELADGLGVM